MRKAGSEARWLPLTGLPPATSGLRDVHLILERCPKGMMTPICGIEAPLDRYRANAGQPVTPSGAERRPSDAPVKDGTQEFSAVQASRRHRHRHQSQELVISRLDIRESPSATAHHHPSEAALAASPVDQPRDHSPERALSASTPSAQRQPLRNPPPDKGKPWAAPRHQLDTHLVLLPASTNQIVRNMILRSSASEEFSI